MSATVNTAPEVTHAVDVPAGRMLLFHGTSAAFAEDIRTCADCGHRELHDDVIRVQAGDSHDGCPICGCPEHTGGIRPDEGRLDEPGYRARHGWRRDLQEARDDARGWCAYLMAEKSLPPRALVVGAFLRHGEVREVAGVLHVPGGVSVDRLRYASWTADDLFSPDAGLAALEHFNRITGTETRVTFRPPGGTARRS
jgi:hypothetical protein